MATFQPVAFYSSLPGLQKKLKWPVLLKEREQNDAGKVEVICKSDNAIFHVNAEQLTPFPNTVLYQRGLDMLKKKPASLMAFIADAKWVSEEENNTQSVKDRKRKRTSTNEQDSDESSDEESSHESVELSVSDEGSLYDPNEDCSNDEKTLFEQIEECSSRNVSESESNDPNEDCSDDEKSVFEQIEKCPSQNVSEPESNASSVISFQDVSAVPESVQGSDDDLDISNCIMKQTKMPSVEDSSEDESEDDSLDKIPDVTNHAIYLAKLVKSETTKLGKKKKTDRVYNATQVCPFCKRPQTNFSHHLFSKKHADEEQIKQIKAMEENSAARKRAIELLRLKGNHMMNVKVRCKSKGQIRLMRRKDMAENDEFFDIDMYGPCPNCLGWILKRNLLRHRKSCPGQEEKTDDSLYCLIVQSDIISRRISPKASKLLVKEVFTIMKTDEVSAIAKEDHLIVNLGNVWMKRNIGNKVMRRYYTSSVIRLAAKLLIEVRKLTNSNEDMCSLLTPKHFNEFVVAALKCSKQHGDDEENLQSPSNCIKLGFDLKRLACAKYALGITNDNPKMKKEGKEFLKLMGIHWATEVNRVAREVLTERARHKPKALPLPKDVLQLTEFMKTELRDFDETDKSSNNFKRVAHVALARLTLFNRRRCHEVQATRLDSYQHRKIDVDSVSLEMMRHLTDFEKKLLESQELMHVRGKMAKDVPVIIPDDAVPVLRYLANPEVRRVARIRPENPYLFAASGLGVVRAYDAIKKMTDEAGLKMPNLIRTSNMRKYMATMVQCLDTTEAQREWIVTHLGHTMNVHLTHYRQTSDILERVEVAKMLLIQDTNQVSKFVGRKIEDVNLEEIMSSNEVGGDMEPSDEQEEVIPDILDMYDESVDDPTTEVTAKKKMPVRQRWTAAEEMELEQLFKLNIRLRKCPNSKDCERAIRISLKRNGFIHKRKPDTIKKKMSNKLIKLRQTDRQ